MGFNMFWGTSFRHSLRQCCWQTWTKILSVSILEVVHVFFFGIKFLIMIYLTAYICRLILFQILTTPKKSHLYSLLVFRTCCWMVLLGLQLPTWISYLSNMISLTLKNLNGCLWVYSLSSVLFSSCSQVGMATNIPPHNLGELVDALSVLIHNPEATVSILLVKHHYLMCSFPFFFWT